LRVAVDIGGTFTDVVVFDEAKSSLTLAKTLSTPAELARGVLDGLSKAAVRFGDVSTLIHGSTIVINAIIERQGAKTALVTTKGFRDVYEIGRINRPESFNPRFRKHRPLVPRENIFEVSERRLADIREGSADLLADDQERLEQVLTAEQLTLSCGSSPSILCTNATTLRSTPARCGSPQK